VGVGENVGVMFVNFHSVHDFTESELDNLNLLGRFAAFAMQSTMLLEKMDNLRELSSRLNVNTIALEASYELSQVAEKLLNDLAISNKVEFKKGTIHFV